MLIRYILGFLQMIMGLGLLINSDDIEDTGERITMFIFVIAMLLSAWYLVGMVPC